MIDVSVIIPLYNHEDYIVEAINSVVSQTYTGKIELIVIDDCSKDQSYNKVKNFINENKFQNVYLKKNKVNLGACKTINKGISFSKGSYITFLNSDDYYDKSRIKSIIDEMLKYKAKICFTGVKTNLTSAIFNSLNAQKILQFSNLPIELEILKNNIGASTGNLFVKKSFIEEIGLFNDLKYCHDWDFLLRASLFTRPLYINEKLYFYRNHTTNTFKSFEQTQASRETKICYHNYFRQIVSNNFTNCYSLNEDFYKDKFEYFLIKFGLWREYYYEKQYHTRRNLTYKKT